MGQAIVIYDSTGNNVTLEENGSIPVTLQDQTSPVVIVPFNKITNSTTNTVATALDDYTVTVDDATGFSADDFISIWNLDLLSVWFGKVVGAPVGSVVTVDRPIDGVFPTGSIIEVGETNMAVDGSSTTQIFSIRSTGGDFPISIDITRIIITIYTDSAVDLASFGDLTKLSYGVTMRRTGGTVTNILNWKSNGELGGICFDMNFYTAIGQGQDGLVSRLTFAGQSKMGAVIRIGQDEDLEIVINDNLTGLDKFEIIAEDSLVVP